MTYIVGKFVTALRANSCEDVLNAAGIPSTVLHAKWVNKRLPPPPYFVVVDEANGAAADTVWEDGA